MTCLLRLKLRAKAARRSMLTLLALLACPMSLFAIDLTESISTTVYPRAERIATDVNYDIWLAIRYLLRFTFNPVSQKHSNE